LVDNESEEVLHDSWVELGGLLLKVLAECQPYRGQAYGYKLLIRLKNNGF
jgi:hypothetical protein